jgi:phage portal protein BeeE
LKLFKRLTSAPEEQRTTLSFDEYVALLSQYPVRPLTAYGSTTEAVAHDYATNVANVLKRNGPIFALIAFRTDLFSQVRWAYRQRRNGKPGDIFSNPTLDAVNDDPQLNKWMIIDNDLAGNFYGYRDEGRVTRLRPDWVQVAYDKPLDAWDARVEGFLYYEGGILGKSPDQAVAFDAEEVIHWYDRPDPERRGLGMSWISPIAREIAADNAANTHKLKFFENGATPNLVFKFPEQVTPASVREFKENFDTENVGIQNAYKNMWLGGGADATVIGADLKQLEFSITQGKGESRLASAARVPAVLVGVSEGLQAATYSNYASARRMAADGLLHPLWVSAAGAIGNALLPPPGSEFWYDSRDIPFLREDAKDDAAIKAQEASTIRQLVDAGFEHESIVAAMAGGDWTLLEHTGLFSVQLQPPGTEQNEPAVDPTD